MGKRLIVKGADFSVNALEGGTMTNITSLFTLNESSHPWSVTTGSHASSQSTYFCAVEDLVDISSYVGKTLRITSCKFTPTSGNISNFGHIFQDSGGNHLTDKDIPFELYTVDGPNLKADFYEDIEITDEMKYIGVSYPKAATWLQYGGQPFAAYIIG